MRVGLGCFEHDSVNSSAVCSNQLQSINQTNNNYRIMKLFNHKFKTTITLITLVLLLLVISNTINAFDSNEKVRNDLHKYIMAHTEGVKDMRHGQYAFAFYGSLGAQGGAFPLNRFTSLDLTAQGTSYYVCDINDFRYFKEKEEIIVKNPINYNIIREETNQPPIVAAPITVLQTMSKLTTSPYHSESVIIKSLGYFTDPNYPKPKLVYQPIRYLYTQYHPCSVCTTKIMNSSFVNDMTNDNIRIRNLNGLGAMLPSTPPPTTPIAYKINSEESVTNLLLPSDTSKERLYLSFSRQWDIDYCHYINIRKLAAKPGIQVVSAATNRYGDRHVGYQSTLVTELERSSMIDTRRPDGSIVSELFTFPTTFKSRESNWQYLINQAFDFFIANKVENFRSFESWKAFLDSAGYQQPFYQIVEKALVGTKREDCDWSQTIQRVKGGKGLMLFKETMIPIDPPFDVSEPTCKPNAPLKKFPCLKTPLPNFVKDPNPIQKPDCVITSQFRDRWNEAIIESVTQTGKPTPSTLFIDEKTEEFKCNSAENASPLNCRNNIIHIFFNSKKQQQQFNNIFRIKCTPSSALKDAVR
ncbi:hypothetical protein DFA_12261 [Cavenderia fasciculata]|uniref:Uncharacterized protein n=1 Tax=Cavenderia fasciculata TaxID=261658 RepID=F4QCW3_CACFS|nr:uncharacterized protein DFA_12261 [Cavenderia fasciculata]EGG14487.1 hypothetical protein DFA_12261 [Cavenderia fasciculata]|eukprot:XP_004353896.1 hypothetical protein DFA_12261 [Cavenderia fasciculata]